jgi:2-polyprenyl-3-methyl-5-hydroxy-6-metoxy-1,4-benzoquinol methylase
MHASRLLQDGSPALAAVTRQANAFSTEYDRFVNWPGRLRLELPFLQTQLRQGGVKRVLDSACGTGMHAIALAQEGFEAAGADISAGMIESRMFESGTPAPTSSLNL